MQESLLKQDEVSLESPFRISINQHVPQATSCFLGLPKPWAMQCVWIVLPHVAQGKVISSWHRCLDADWAYHGGPYLGRCGMAPTWLVPGMMIFCSDYP